MADADFEGTWEAYRDLLKLLKERGCYFLNGMLVREEDDLYVQPRIKSESDLHLGNHQWYAFSEDWTVEPMETRPVDNIHQGRVYSANSMKGGPFLEILAFKRQDGTIHIRVGYKPHYYLTNTVMRPPNMIKELYKELQILLKQAGCIKVRN